MLSIKYLRENIDLVQSKMVSRGQQINFDSFLKIESERKEILSKEEELKHKRNRVSDEIGKMKRENQSNSGIIEEMKMVSDQIKILEDKRKEYDKILDEFLLMIPNIPHSSVPEGRDSNENKEIRKWGNRPELTFKPKAHWEIGENLGILDFERGTKITGARFTLYKNLGARLERALINFMLDIHTKEHGYMEILPPFLVNRRAMIGTGQLPKFEEDLFRLKDEDYFLIPTAEVPLTNIHQGETISEEALPIYYTAYTPCFRREAGSYGKDTRGLIRQHQFNKVELVKFTTPERSYEELEKLLSNAEEILKRLNIHYRVVALCTGDLGFSAAKTYDIEVWLPGQNTYREISSCSNFEEFQARRADIRYKPKGKQKNEYLHTLNGSGLAVGRTLVAILENYQREDGTIKIPQALIPYMGGKEEIVKS